MFGKRNLQRDGAAAQAVVISATAHGNAVGVGGMLHVDWHVRASVRPADGAAYETEFRIDSRDLRVPIAGRVVPVRIDPKDPAHVELDQAALRAPAPDLSGVPSDEDIAATNVAWDVARAQATEFMDAYQDAKARGRDADAKQLLAEGQAFNAEQIRLGDEVKAMRARRGG